jgi:PadR family transcriptional regulator, regulatory protein PadR
VEHRVAHKGNLGDLEMLVLAALIRLAPDAYGVNVHAELETRGKRKISIGSLYTTLSRLEEKGLASSRLGEATSERGGRAKKYYEVTAQGRTQLDRSISALHRMVEGLGVWPAPKKS